MSKLLKIIIALVAIIGIFAGVIMFKGVELMQKAAADAGNNILKASITFDDVALNPFSGAASIDGLHIGQPEGFGDSDSFAFNAFAIDLVPMSLFDDVIEIETILIDQPALNLVMQGQNTNFGTLQANVDEALGESESASTKVTIRDLYLNSINLKIDSDRLGSHDITLADIHLTNIGIDEGGVEPKEIFRLAMEALRPQIGKALVELGIRNQLTEGIGANVREQIDQEIGKLPNSLQDAASSLLGGSKDKTEDDDGGN